MLNMATLNRLGVPEGESAPANFTEVIHSLWKNLWTPGNAVGRGAEPTPRFNF